MSWYHFKGNNTLGNAIQGQCHAESEFALTSRLHAAGITPFSIKKLDFFNTCLLNIKKIFSYLYPVKKADISLFYYQLANLLEVDVPLKSALFVIVNHLDNPRLVQVVHDMIVQLSRGASFSDALQKYQRLFSAETVHLISFAQSREELMAILYYCDQAMRHSTFAKRIFFVAMPQVSLTIVFFIALLFLRERYLPAFNYAIYVFKQPVPMVIRVFDTITSIFSIHLLQTVIIILLIIFSLKSFIFLSKKLKLFYHVFLYYFPVVSRFVLAVDRERLALFYSVLLKGGASVQKCAQCSAAVINNVFFRRRVSAMSAVVQQGESFPNALKFYRIFNAAEVQMITLGAVSNSLVKAFERIYSICQLMLERRVLMLIEFIRFLLYMFNALLFFFIIFVTETLFYYPGSH